MSQQHILQVSELTKKVRFILESELNTVWLCGEISNFIAASSGHWYLSLKDSKSQVKCAMFKGNNRRVRLTGNGLPANGQQVLVRAKVSLYEPRGDFQLIIEQMENAGEGLLRQQYEQLKNNLNAEGLFGQYHKLPLPIHVSCVGIVTSATGAAIKDILTVLKRRNPLINVIIYPASVQGKQAQYELVNAINIANIHDKCDVLIVGRGGGSLEDLWPFNEEAVVRAIHKSKLPIISAVGHEVDTTLSDYVADLRAATPSAAAELVSQDSAVIIDKISLLKQRLVRSTLQIFSQSKIKLDATEHRLLQVHPKQQLQYQQQKFDELNIRLLNGINKERQRFKNQPYLLQQRLLQLSPEKEIRLKLKQVQQHKLRMINAITRQKENKEQQFVHLIEQLNIVSPLATIARGYSVTRNIKNAIVKNTQQVSAGDLLAIQLQDGFIKAIVKDVNKNTKDIS